MALSDLYGWNRNSSKAAPSSACGTACGAPDKPDDKPSPCGSACGAPDK